ncbi:MAG: ABC transporter permease [Propionibacteriaceae bacterium]|jgi:peptide/nickel transport system permease protein|nr:ABC transporter permease [Propionibacteriaceae bacterium]
MSVIDIKLAPLVLSKASRTVTKPQGVGGKLLRRPTFVLSVLILGFWVAAPVVLAFLGLDGLNRTGGVNQPPGGGHPFGTDNLGRDVFIRTLAGAGPILTIAPAATAIATVVGAAMGLAAGYFRGIVDDLLMRSFDILHALPGIIAILLVTAAFGRSPVTIMIAIGIFFAPIIARTVRSAVFVETGKQYVESARSQGESTWRILFVELLPNVAPTLIVEATIRLGFAVFASAGLSFLGLGAQPPSPDWGLVVSQNRIFIQTAWWSVTFPALAIMTLVVAVNLIADNLREVLQS